MKDIERIGVDWLTISDFEIKYDESVAKKEIASEYTQERLRIDDSLFSLDNTMRIYSNNRITQYKYLRFNPNKILIGNNIANSRSSEIREALVKLKEILKRRGIEVDLTHAKIKEIEININIYKPFSYLKETFELLFIKSPQLKKISNYNGGLSYKNLFTDRTIQGNWQSYSGIVYDKTAETNDPEVLIEQVTRLEWRFTSAIYNYYTKINGIDTKLESLLNNFEVIDIIFKNHCNKKLRNNAVQHINNVIKPSLERGYDSFKKSAKLARETNRRVERNVYKYLEDNYWIFDYSFLIELINKKDSKNKTREIERIKKKYICHNNLEKLDYLANYIFLTNLN